MKNKMPVLKLITLSLLLGTYSLAQAQLTASKKQELKEFLLQDCGACHGMTLKGSLGPALLPSSLAGKSQEFLTYTILNGRPGTAMPPWKGILNREEANWIAEQLLKGVKND